MATMNADATSLSSTGRTMAASLTETIRRDIIHGTLAPGVKLRIKALGERYGAGAIPLREALSRLASTGFVEAEDQRGFRVSGMSARELKDITNTRVLIEKEALSRSITAGGLAWEEAVVASCHRMSRTPVYLPGGQINAEWERAHAAFHNALLGACDSSWLIRLANSLREQTDRYRHLALLDLKTGDQVNKANKTNAKEGSRNIPDEHEELMQAALRKDAVKACELLAGHIRLTSQAALELYERLG